LKHTHRHRWLLLAPFAWQVGLAPLVNDVATRPFGLPFPMAWQMAGIVLTSAVIGLVYWLDQRSSTPDDEA
jgi:hypothetical protein